MSNQSEMTKTLSALIIGAGDRGNIWIGHSETSGAGIVPVAVADTNPNALNAYGEKHNIPKENRFNSGEKALEKTDGIDAVLITTPDATHRDLAVLALETGNNVLLEKPMATTEQDCRDIIGAQQKSGTVLSVGHVLRYSPFFAAMRSFVDSGEFGRLVDIDMDEEVANWHFAHSYVRGNWRDSRESSPVILAKSCHDLDIISWFADSRIKSVTSQGSLKVFTPENAPEGAKMRCTNGCNVNCQYDARKFYLGDHTENANGVRWPYGNIAVFPANASIEQTREIRQRAIEETSYGNCVYHSDNDVVDNQNVSMVFENGVRASFRLRAWGNLSDRNMKLYFENGEVTGNLGTGNIRKQRYHGIKDIKDIEEMNIADMNAHGGGDPYLIKNFADMIRNPDTAMNRTSAELSLQSHLIAFAAEKSRKTGQRFNF